MDKARALLKVCGINDAQKIGKNYKMRCAVNEDREPSCGLHEDGYFKCFSCGACGGPVEFVMHRMNVDAKVAKRMLGQKENLITDIEKLLTTTHKKGSGKTTSLPIVYNYPSGNMIPLEGKYKRYVSSRGITQKQVEQYKIMCAKRGRFRGRIVFPINMGGKCWGVTARAVRDDTEPKWLHSKFAKTRLLYGYDHFRIGNFGEAILVEGVMDYLALKRLGEIGRGVLATFNAQLSVAQAELIKALGVKRLLVAYDIDKAGHQGYFDIIKESGEEFDVIRWLYSRTGDPDSVNPKLLKKRYNSRHFIRHVYDEYMKGYVNCDVVFDFI